MQLVDLYNSNIRNYLVDNVKSINLDKCTNEELTYLANWISNVKERADMLTLEDEIVGYTYNNLDVLIPKVQKEEEKRGVVLVKIKNNRSAN